MTYYVKGGSVFDNSSCKLYAYLDLNGYPDSEYENRDDSDLENQDPYWRLGGSAGGVKEAQFGLYNDRRIKCDETGVYGWDGSQWVDLLAPGGVSDHGELTGLEDDDHSQYHNDSRANTWLGTKSTTNLSEGTNLYHTTVRVENVITAELVNGQSIDNRIDTLISNHNVANRHIDHTTISITAGTGLTGGGTIAANRTINCSITQYTNALAISAVQNAATLIPQGNWNFDTDTGTHPLLISRLGNATQALSIYVDDTYLYFNYAQDEVASEAHSVLYNITSGASGNHSYIFKVNAAEKFKIGDDGIVASNPLDMNQHQISDLPAPSAANDAARKVYVDGKVSDVAYAGTWGGVTTIAPSKNAVYDKIQTLSGGLIMATGTYTGNGALNRQITGLGITPKSLFIIAHNNDNPDGSWLGHKTDDMALWKILRVHTPQILDNAVKIIADGFEVYNTGGVNWWNGNGLNYYYTAWG